MVSIRISILVGAHELGGLGHQRAAEAVGVKRHRLVAQRVEAHGGQVVSGGNLQLVHGVVLQLAGRLARHVDADKRHNIGAEHGKHLVGLGGRGAHAIHDQAHHEGVAVGQQRRERERRHHEGHKQPQVPFGDHPEVMQRAPRGRGVAHHIMPFVDLVVLKCLWYHLERARRQPRGDQGEPMSTRPRPCQAPPGRP